MGAKGPLDGATVIFDLDGTLIDTAADMAAAMNHALAHEGLAPASVAEVRNLVGHGARRMIMRAFELATGRPAEEAMLALAAARFHEYYQDNIADHSAPFEGAVAVIERLRADGAVVAICTNKREDHAVRLMKSLGLDGLFATIVGGDTASAAKPDPAPVRLCFEATGATRAVFVGDSDTDIRAAEAASLPSFIATFGYGPVTLHDKVAGLFDAYDHTVETDLRSALFRPA